MARKQTNLSLPEETLTRLDAIANMLGVSRTKALELLLRHLVVEAPKVRVSAAALREDALR
jgi:predicted DNA-binding protein